MVQKDFKPVTFDTEYDDAVSNVDDMGSVLKNYTDSTEKNLTCLNSFDTISYSRYFDLLGLFEKNQL